MQERRNPIANALVLRLSCTNIYHHGLVAVLRSECSVRSVSGSSKKVGAKLTTDPTD